MLEEGYVLAGRYEIQGLVGEGGMARVYEAWCRVLKRRVAIKFLRSELLQDEEVASYFQGEARAAASLSHPHIVPIFDVGESEEGQFIVMEYVDGPNLKQYLREHGPLPLDQVITLGKQVAYALKYAHEQGIVHRDIKPHNILLSQDGMAKVADFGLARVASESTLQVDRQAMGSIHYCAPEQARGGFSTTASDIYSLGAVMYEMATGRVPFSGETAMGIAYQHLHHHPVAPRELRPDITPALERVILSCLRKHQGERYSHAGYLVQDLDALEKGTGLVHARSLDENEFTQRLPGNPLPSPQGTSARKRWRPDRRLLILAGIFMAVLLMLGVGRLAISLLFPPLIAVPDVVGMTLGEAERVAEENEMVLEVTGERYSNEVPEDIVLEQDPEPGEERRMQSPLRVVISLGPEQVEIPDLQGLAQSVAEARLEDRGLELGDVDRVYDERLEAGLVSAQHPAPGTEVELGTTVDLSISRGAPPAQAMVPDLRGRHRNDAAASLESANLKVGRVREEYNEIFAKHYVIQQRPGPNATVPEGSSVELTVSLGPVPRAPEGGEEEDEEQGES